MSVRRRIIATAGLLVIFYLLLRLYPLGTQSRSIPVPEDGSVRDRLAAAFPYNPKKDLPKRIFQTWKVSPAAEDFPPEYGNSVASWTELNPDFEHIVLTDIGAASLIGHLYARVPEVTQAYNALPQPILKADFFRYLVLLARGGIYSDVDTRALQPVAAWINATMEPWGMIVGIEADPNRPDWQDWYARRIQFCQWTIGSKSGHPVLIEIVAAITEKTLEQKALFKSAQQIPVMEFTGPGAWTDSLFHFFEIDDALTDKQAASWERFANLTEPIKHNGVVVLPITSFSPGIGHMGAKGDDDPMAFVRHAFSGSWKQDSKGHER